MRNSGFKFKFKKRLKFRHIYAIFMLGVTIAFAWSVINLLVIEPIRAEGLLLGNRMDGIDELNEDWLRQVEVFGSSHDDISYVEIFWNRGPVVYVSVRFDVGIRRSDARRAARDVMEYFRDISDETFTQYNFQIVISYGDIEQQRKENEAAILENVHRQNYEFGMRVLQWAEEHRSAENIQRARINFTSPDSRVRPSVIEIVGEDGWQELVERIDNIVEVHQSTDEDAPPIPRYPGTLRVEQTNISNFPNWGAWDHNRNRITWN